MKKKWFVRSCVVAAVCFATTTHADSLHAQGTKGQSSSSSATEVNDPSVLSLGIAPINTFLPNAQHLARLIGGGQVAGGIQSVVTQFTNGIDKTRPAGVFVELDESGTPSPVVCLPLKSFDDFKRQLAILGEPEDLGDGLYAFYYGNPIFLRNIDEWIIAGQSEDAVLNFDTATTDNLKGLVGKYDLRLQVNPQNIPSELVEFFLAQVEQGLQQGMAQNPDLDEEAQALAQQNADQAVQNMRDLIEGTNKLMLGLAIDPKSKKTVLDLGSQFVSGSKFAKQLENYQGATAALAAVGQESSALRTTSVQFVAPEDLKRAEDSLDASLEAIFKELDEKNDGKVNPEIAKKLIRRIADLALNTAREGRVESAFDLNLENDLDAVLAFSVADGKEVDATIAEFAQSLDAEAKKEVTITTNAGKIGNANLHRISIRLPEDADEVARQIFGSNVEIAVASTSKAAFISVGKNCEASAKNAIERVAAKPSSPASMITARTKLSKIAAFIEKIKPNPISAAILATTSSGNDSVNVDSQISGLDSAVRVTIEDQVFRSIQEGMKASKGDDGF